MNPPGWLSIADETLREAMRRVRMIFATTPIGLAAELDRLAQRWERGEPVEPQFTYQLAVDHSALIGQLEELAERLAVEGPLGRVYADRALELSMEAAVCSAVNTQRLASCARKRFGRRDHFDDAADVLAKEWLGEPFDVTSLSKPNIWSDDPADPRSLLVRMKSAIGARRIPFRVVVARDSSALAATGEGFVQIAAARRMTEADVERTVLHEIEGHVLPRCRANAAPIGIFALGTRWGVDDQEGRALCIERRGGVLSAFRRRELASRHSAVRMMESGADFVQTTHRLLELGLPLADALRITARAFRGGGLGREVVYLPAFLRIDAALRANPDIDDVLGAGRVSVDAVDVLRPWVGWMH